MSFLWDTRGRRPQLWTYPFFIVIPILIFLFLYNYGDRKASYKEAHSSPAQEDVR